MSSGRIVYSTGDLDYSIAARLIPPEYLSMQVYNAVIDMYATDVAIFKIYSRETHRHGKAKAGHYTRVFK
jgi:hypothetical protein